MGAVRITGTGEIDCVRERVPGIATNCAAPSYLAVNAGPFCSGTVAVCGIEFSIAASRASRVPATVGSTAPASDVGGIFAKSAGSASLATNVHGPVNAADRNQRPASSTK